jgi:hypothetical protein
MKAQQLAQAIGLADEIAKKPSRINGIRKFLQSSDACRLL